MQTPEAADSSVIDAARLTSRNEGNPDLPAEWKTLIVEQGTAHVYFAFDVGQSINLTDADQRITSAKERIKLKSKKRVSKYFDFSPAPIRVTYGYQSVRISDRVTTSGIVEALIFDFGAISVSLKIPIKGSFSDLILLSDELYDNPTLKEQAHSFVQVLLNEISPAVTGKAISGHSEDYRIFEVEKFENLTSVNELIGNYPHALASLLRAEVSLLSDQEIQEIITDKISYGVDDLTLLDFHTSFIYGEQIEDIRTIIEFANVALMEYSHLDQQLDKALDDYYELFSLSRTKPSHRFSPRQLKKLAQFQIDSAILFESVANSLKLLGDEFLSRVYRTAALKLGITQWDVSITRKLGTIESIYQKISDTHSTRILHTLEWIIIALIAISIILPFFPGFSG